MGAHHHHHHIDPESMGDSRLIAAVAVNLVLTVAQAVAGVFAGSLSLIADALHNFSDAASLFIALFARKIARRPADHRRTYGYKRAEIIAALINLTTLIIVGFYLIVEGVSRFFSQEPVKGWVVVWVAGGALVIDLITAALTYSQSKDNMNIKAAFLHNVSDALASVGVIGAGIVIILYDLYIVDLVAALVIAVYVIYQGTSLMNDSISILMESVPRDIDINEVQAKITAIENVEDAHHIHVRQLDEHRRFFEGHVVIRSSNLDSIEQIKANVRAVLRETFGIHHSTIEIELATLQSPECSSTEEPCF